MKNGATMQTIIQNKLSEMLNELLEKALEEKPDLISKYSFRYDYRFSVCIIDENLYDITIAVKKNMESMGNYVSYVYDLTDEQKEKIKQIFKKWRKENENDN